MTSAMDLVLYRPYDMNYDNYNLLIRLSPFLNKKLIIYSYMMRFLSNAITEAFKFIHHSNIEKNYENSFSKPLYA